MSPDGIDWLDKKDRELLYRLDVDGRTTYSGLARKLRISKQMVKYRVKRMEDTGLVKGYYTMIDSSKLGFVTFRIYIKFRGLEPLKKGEIISYLKEKKSIWAIVSMAGKWDLALAVAVKDIYGFYDVWDEILENYLKSIEDYKIAVYSPIYHYSKAYLIGVEDNSKVRILGGKEKAELDKKDLKILSLLSSNARMSVLDLSRGIGLTPEAVSRRIKELERKEVIQGYRAMIDTPKIGYEYYKADIRLSSYRDIEKILAFCHANPNIYQVDKTIGGETLEIEFQVRSLREMLQIIDEFQSVFPDSVERFDYLTILSEEKTTYMPDLA